MNTGTKETAATLILGYAAPSRPEFHQRMVWLLAWFIAFIPLLHIAETWPLVIHRITNGAGPFSIQDYPREMVRFALLFTAEPFAALLLAWAVILAATRRRITTFTVLAIAISLFVTAIEILLRPMWYWSEFQYDHRYALSILFMFARLAPIAFPMLLFLLLNPTRQLSFGFRARQIYLLTLLTCIVGASEMVVTTCFTPSAWEGPIRDFWAFLDGNIPAPLTCLGQLTLDTAILMLSLLLSQYVLSRRLNATLLRATTSLLLVGWFLLTASAIPAQSRIFLGSFSDAVDLSAYLEFGFLHVGVIEYGTPSIGSHLLEATQFLASATFPLLFILSLRIALNRPELPWNAKGDSINNDASAHANEQFHPSTPSA